MSSTSISVSSASTASYWDTIPTNKRRDLAEQLLAHSNHYPVCIDNCFNPTGDSIKHPDCFWCGVGAHLDCDYDFLKKLPKQKLDEIASFARAFFRHDYQHLLYPSDATKTAGTGADKEKGDV